ncbi:MAG: DUF481 domain-containing protein [Planctomycetota bacterium]
MVKLNRGDVLIGDIIERDTAMIVLHHELFGRMEIPVDLVLSATVDAPESEAEEVDALATQDAADETVKDSDLGRERDPEEQPPEPGTPRKEWSGNLNIALNTSAGNTDESTLRLGGDLRRETPRIRFNLDTTYYFKESSGETTDNRFTFGGEHDWLVPVSPWFWFVQGRFDYDEFESWEQRVNGHGGPGYQFYDTESFRFSGRVGLGARREFGSENDELQAEALFGLNLAWKINDRQTLELGGRYFPVVTDPDDFRTRSTISWRWLLDNDLNLSLNAGLTHEYQSIVDPGSDRNDLRVFVGLGIGF